MSVDYPTVCPCGEPIYFRRPCERGVRKFCSLPCARLARRGKRTASGLTERVQQVIDEAGHLAGTDYPDNIAVRLGYENFKSLERILTKAQAFDLADRLRRDQIRYMKAVGGSDGDE